MRATAAPMAPITAGVVGAVVGFTSSFTVVLTGLRAVGASEEQARSGLLALSVLMGLGCIGLSARFRMPLTVAWSTPGAALLAASTAEHPHFDEAVAAFLVCGALLLAVGVVPLGARLVAKVPTVVSAALLAGVLFPVCVQPVHAVDQRPALALPVVGVWLVATRFARRWAVPLAVLTAGIGVAIDHAPGAGDHVTLLPRLDLTSPSFSLSTVLGLGLPLFLVTMAGQNIPGLAVLRSFSYEPPVRPALATTAGLSLLSAPAGGHALNLAALSAALSAGPDAGPDRSRRWIAGVSNGCAFVVLGLTSTLVASLTSTAPVVLVEGVAGLALIGAFSAALTDALEAAETDPSTLAREAAVITFLVAASGTSLGGLASPVWALVAGLVVHALGRRRD